MNITGRILINTGTCLALINCVSTKPLPSEMLLPQVAVYENDQGYMLIPEQGVVFLSFDRAIPVNQASLSERHLKNLEKDGFSKWYSLLKVKRIVCLGKESDSVVVKIDGNSQLHISTNYGKKYRLYFKSCEIYGDSLKGDVSVLLGIEKRIALQDITEIKLYSEFKRELPLTGDRSQYFPINRGYPLLGGKK